MFVNAHHYRDGGDGLDVLLNVPMTTPTGSYRCTPLGHVLGTPTSEVRTKTSIELDWLALTRMLM